MKKIIFISLFLFGFVLNVMATDYVRKTTWVTGDLITASKLNADPDETARILGTSSNGLISNGNVKSTAAITESKILFDATSGHNHDGVDSKLITADLDTAYNSGKTITADDGAIVINKSDNTATLDLNKTATGTGNVIDIANAGTGEAIFVSQTGVTAAETVQITSTVAQTNATLVYLYANNASTTKPALTVQSTGSGEVIKVNTTTSGAHFYLVPTASSSYATEGGVYSDTDNRIYYYNGSAWEALDNTADYAEPFGSVGNSNIYKEGDVVVISSEPVTQAKKDKINDLPDEKRSQRGKKLLLVHALKAEKSSSPYQTNVLGVVSYRSYRNWTLDDEIPVALLGQVACNVNDEGGPIAVGDLLTTSSKKGEAMKATIDSFDKIGSIIGKAREPFTGNKGQIEIVVGVK